MKIGKLMQQLKSMFNRNEWIEWGEEEDALEVYEIPSEASDYDPYWEEEDLPPWDFDGFTQ